TLTLSITLLLNHTPTTVLYSLSLHDALPILGDFREDLYHRLNVIRIQLPPLRDRTEDIPSLARYFLQKTAKELGVETKVLHQQRSEEHTSELQSRFDLVCRLLLEKKKKTHIT